jgi:hypothetical protein
MRAQILSISSIPRSTLPSSREEAELRGFRKALRALESLKPCNKRETIVAIENWAAAGMLSEAEADELFEHHGWRRG